mmetsp:Transcript_5728/g.9389  ORF Transcript_5728/g.9389 Transcript_5728/m.9389 type:complete len:328 (-) Transcript_5728:215-1198(-)
MRGRSEPASGSLVMLFMLGWGLIFVGAFFVRAVYFCIRQVVLGDEGRRSNETLECYRTMSSARREEIDNLRKNALLRCLSSFTLTLGNEHLLCCSGSQTDTTLSISSNEEDDEDSLTSEETCKEDLGDIEKGNNTVMETRDDLSQGKDSISREAAVSAIEYTHISIPLPGYDIAGINICSIEGEKQDRQVCKRWKLHSLFQTKDDNVGEEPQTEQTEPVTVTIINNTKPKQLLMVEKRSVPIFCAICLSEYEKCDRVCWSSNIECSHVFHEDCILQWLISSGKKRSMNQHFTRQPTDEELLENEFCPCCRQDFICVKQALHVSQESV